MVVPNATSRRSLQVSLSVCRSDRRTSAVAVGQAKLCTSTGTVTFYNFRSGVECGAWKPSRPGILLVADGRHRGVRN
eukprot:scaffold232990_cov31-Prasinocladus_malaysianus.AAC.1